MWKDLTLQQKAEIMKMSVANGVTDINDIQQLYDGSVGHRFDDAGRIITLADLPREYVQKYGHINVVTPKGVRMPLSQAYRDYNQTPINVNDVPGLTDYLIKQDQPDISEQAHIDKVAADRFVHQLGEERDKALIGLTAAITGGGALASGLALAPVATIGSTIGGIAGEKLFNTGYEKLTGSNWGQDVERWTNGYIPAEYGEYLNPGALVGGVAAEPLRKFVGRSAYKGFLSLPQTKRAVEVAMRTTGNANPLEEMSAHINYLLHAPEERQQAKDVLHYIATGKRQPNRPYRSLNSQGDVYTGLIGDYPEEFEYEPLIQIPEALSKDIGNDYIDAYLYGKQISPKLFNYKGTSDKVDNVFKEYVNRVYPNKKVQVYEAPIPHNAKAVNQNELTNVHNHGVINPMHTNDPRVVADTSGHLMYTANMDGANPEIRALKEADIWKFNPADYKERYSLDSSPTNIKQKVIQKLIGTGLKIVDDIGNPIIVETPWYTLKNGGHLFDKGGSKNKKQTPKYQYGIIEQILRENGVNFRVTSGFRHPNEAGNAGKSSAHTYALASGSPAAIDIVPGAGSNWNTLYKQMNSPEVRAALASYGLDILDETNPATMAKTKATGKHFHVGKGIKGQQGKGIFVNQNNPIIAAYNKRYKTPNLAISSDMLYNPAQKLTWRQPTQPSIVFKSQPLSALAEVPIPKIEMPVITPIEERVPIAETLPDIAPLLSYLPDQQRVTPAREVIPQYQSPVIDMFNEPYLLFGRT